MAQQTKGNPNVGTVYTQSLLSGYEHLLQSSNTNGDSSSDEQGRKTTPQELKREQKAYQILVPLILEKVGGDGDKLTYAIHFNGNTHLLVSPYSIRGKKTSQDATTVPFKTDEKTVKVRLDYGIHQTGQYPLSHPNGYSPLIQIAHITGFVLDAINTTIERTIFLPEKTESVLDPGSSAEGTPTQENVGTHKAKRRSKKVHPKIHSEALPEVSPQLDEPNRSVLGNRHRDSTDKLAGMGNDTDDRGELKGDTLGF